MGDDILKDSRFAHLLNDPRYKHVPKSERKVKIDKRFQSMFKDKKFKVSYTIDKRGRPISKTSSEDLKKYYDLTSSSEDEDDEEETSDQGENQHAGSFVRAPKSDDDDSDEEESADDTTDANNVNDELERGDIGKKIKKRLKDLTVDYARGEADIASESSSDEESSSEDEEELVLEHCWGELDRDAERTEESTCRLAACNMDWDRMRAVDIMVLCNSFLPKGGLIHSVTIYPSEFGKQRMAEEDVKGPVELTSTPAEYNSEEENDDNEEGSKFHMEKLRQYQLNRLKYYYAVIVFDSKDTAEKLYNECDGLEYESSATKLDLRFIPDDVTFDEKPHDVCTELPDLTKYQPRQFTTTALQQAKVELTWDETCPQRKELTKKLMSGKVDDVADADLKDYLASSSEEEDNDDDKTNGNAEDDDLSDDSNANGKSSLDKYKALLQDIQKKEEAKKNKDVEMEISWGLGLKDKSEKLIKDKLSKKEDMTPFEKMVDKIKEKKKAKREERKKKLEQEENTDSDSSDDIPDGIDMNDPYFQEEFQSSEFQQKKSKKSKKPANDDSDADEKQKKELELLLMDEDDQEKSHFSLKKIQDAENDTKSKSKRRKKLLKRKADESINIPDFEVDVNDERFSALYTSHLFNIDPTDSHYRKTKGMESLINAKLSKRSLNDNQEPPASNGTPSKKSKTNVAMNMMVKNIKRNTQKIANK